LIGKVFVKAAVLLHLHLTTSILNLSWRGWGLNPNYSDGQYGPR
jgi:hypothetical protein